MKRKKKDLQETESRTKSEDEMLDELLDELRREDNMVEEMKEQLRQRKRKFWRKVIIISSLVLFILVGSYLLIHYQTYTSARTVATYATDGLDNNYYKQFTDGVLRYSRDGIAFLDRKGEERWNQSYQIKTPLIDVNDEAAAVADKGGNDIVVVDRQGLKGEIHTTLPIEKISVSEQGIVSALVKNDSGPSIMTYDAMGNILAEVKTSFSGTGYPLDIGISKDGKTLLVSYMSVQNGKTDTNIVYYYFDEAKKEDGDYKVLSETYEDMLAPTAFFMSDSAAVVAGDDRVLIYDVKETPELQQTISLNKKVKSVFYNQRYIGLILKNEGKAGYELRLYNVQGQEVLSADFTGDYSNVKLDGNQVIMYDGKKCSVFTRSGIHKFEGELGKDILEMVSTFGVNKYIVMNADGMEVVRFVK